MLQATYAAIGFLARRHRPSKPDERNGMLMPMLNDENTGLHEHRAHPGHPGRSGRHLHAALAGAMLLLVAGGVVARPQAAPATVPPLTHVPVAATETVGDVALAPYEVTYDIRLKEVSERSGIIFASGHLFSQLKGGPCEGWTSLSRMRVRFVFARRGTRETESRVTSWESDDGNRYHSLIQRYLNNRKLESVKVSVSRAHAGAPFILRQTEPEKRVTTLPADTLFPTAALRRILHAARHGRRHLSLLIYEGDREAAPQRVAVIIGRRQTPRVANASTGGDATAERGHGRKAGDEEGTPAWLSRQPYWPVSLAYYGVVGGPEKVDGNDGGEADREAEERRFGLPEYEVHFRLYDNGVAGDAMLVYPDYMLEARVKDLRMLPPAACD